MKKKVLGVFFALVLLLGLVPIIGVQEVSAEPANEPEEPVVTYVGSDGKSYSIYASTINMVTTNENGEYSLAEIFAAAGVPDDALAECSYKFTGSEGSSVILRASDYENFGFCYDSTKSCWKNTLLDKSEETGVWYEVAGIKKITAIAHDYSAASHICTNQINKTASSFKECADYECEVMNYVGADEATYSIYASTIKTVTPNEDGEYSLAEVFVAAGIPDDALAECSYKFTGPDGSSATLSAADYNNFGLYYDSTRSCWKNTLLDTSVISGGWYKITGLERITAISHEYSTATHKCTNQINVTRSGFKDCGAGESAIMNYIDADGVTYPIYASTFSTVTTNEKGEYTLAEIFAAAGISDDALAECSYKFTGPDGSSVILSAADYGNFGFYYDATKSCWNNTLLDKSAVTGEWYKVTGLDTITALKHSCAASKHTCENLITTGDQQTTVCGGQVTVCEDKDLDHYCDNGCGKYFGEHADKDDDHNCDYCGEKLSEHTGGKANCTSGKICEICKSEYGTKDLKNHVNLKHFSAKTATTTKEGNIEYWYCDSCGLYYSNAEATKEIKQSDTVIAKLNKTGSVQTDSAQTGSVQTGSVQTGDHSNISLWMALLFVSGGAVAATVVGRQRKRAK